MRLITLGAIIVWLDVLGGRIAQASPQLDVVGNVFCIDGSSYIPAANVMIEIVEHGVRTRTKRGNGYYQLRGQFSQMYDHEITIIAKMPTRNAGLQIVYHNTFFIGRDRIRNRDGNIIYLMDRIDLEIGCAAFDDSSDIYSDPPPASKRNGWEASGGFLNWGLYLLLLAVANVGGVDDSPSLIITQQAHTGHFGNIQFRNRTKNYRSLGFRYAPTRAVAEAQPVNPSAAALDQGTEISIQSTFPLLDEAMHLVLPAGPWAFGVTEAFMVSSDELLASHPDGGVASSGNYMALESSTHVSVARRILPNFSGAAAARLHVLRIRDFARFVDGRLVTKWHTSVAPDMDVSAAWDILPGLRLGAAILGVFDARTRAVNEQPDGRTIGAGISFCWGRLHLGADAERSRSTGWNGSVGADAMLLNEVEVGGGFLSIANTLRLSLRLRSLLVTWSRSSEGQDVALGARFRFL